MANSTYTPGYNPSPLMTGLSSFVDIETTRQSDEKKRLETDKTELQAQFDTDLKSAVDLLSKVRDPAQREAITQTIEQMRQVYTGSYAQSNGLDKIFNRQIDFALQTPYDEKKYTLQESGNGVGGSAMERMTAAAQDLIKKQEAGIALTAPEQFMLDSYSGQVNKGEGAVQRETGKKNVETLGAMKDMRDKQEAAFQANESARNAINAQGGWQGGAVGAVLPDWSESASNIQRIGTDFALDFVQQTKGSISDSEMGMFKRASIDTKNPKEVNLGIVNMADAILARNAQQLDFFETAMDNGATMEQARKAWAEFTDDPKNKIMKDNGKGSPQLIKSLEDIKTDQSYLDYLPKTGRTFGTDNPAAPNGSPSPMPPALPSNGYNDDVGIKAAPSRLKYNPSTGEFE